MKTICVPVAAAAVAAAAFSPIINFQISSFAFSIHFKVVEKKETPTTSYANGNNTKIICFPMEKPFELSMTSDSICLLKISV